MHCHALSVLSCFVMCDVSSCPLNPRLMLQHPMNHWFSTSCLQFLDPSNLSSVCMYCAVARFLVAHRKDVPGGCRWGGFLRASATIRTTRWTVLFPLLRPFSRIVGLWTLAAAVGQQILPTSPHEGMLRKSSVVQCQWVSVSERLWNAHPLLQLWSSAAKDNSIYWHLRLWTSGCRVASCRFGVDAGQSVHPNGPGVPGRDFGSRAWDCKILSGSFGCFEDLGKLRKKTNVGLCCNGHAPFPVAIAR